MPPFEPYVTFRDVARNSLSFIDPPVEQPSNALARGTNLLLLIHGYNNTVDTASESYRGWRSLQEELGGIGGMNVVAVYWPGSNWENFAVYMQAIRSAEEAARRLARTLRTAAASFGLLRVRIVTHSLGARLAMELLHQLRLNADPRVTIERFVVMAAAVPTFFLAPGRPLRQSLDALMTPFHSLYSPDDRVLGYAFRIGQSLRGEGFFPTALGHAQWRGQSAISESRLRQERNAGAGHGDYWVGNDDASRRRARLAARSARDFLGLGIIARDLTRRDLESRSTDASRVVDGRDIPSRS